MRVLFKFKKFSYMHAVLAGTALLFFPARALCQHIEVKTDKDVYKSKDDISFIITNISRDSVYSVVASSMPWMGLK